MFLKCFAGIYSITPDHIPKARMCYIQLEGREVKVKAGKVICPCLQIKSVGTDISSLVPAFVP